MSTTNETSPLLVPALCQFNALSEEDKDVVIFAYDKPLVDAVVADLQRQLRVATMPTDRATGITGEQSDQLTILIAAYVSAEIDNSWKGGGDPDDVPQIEADLASASAALNEYLTLLRAPV